ncbi:MAG: hypothetical protein AAF802_29595 [Planctomycetota bacterium]
MIKRNIQSFMLPLLLLSPAFTSVASAGDEKGREQKLAEYLSGTQFTGRFTMDGVDAPPKAETYTIESCEKLPAPDLYRLKARIKYGAVDQTVPLDLKILWSGNTPVITLDSIWIPGMGTFDARVLIQADKEGGRYAGTWQHDARGGHLFGKITKIPPQGTEAAKESEQGNE